MMSFLSGVLASLAALLLVYLLYWLAYRAQAKNRATAGCWWLPSWKCFRLVIRNMSQADEVTGVRYRTWLREARPAIPGSSVISWLDTPLGSGERLLLPPREDLVVLSFRYESAAEGPVLNVTDKFGAVGKRIVLRPEHERLMLEYSLRVRTWFLFKGDVTRVYEVPRYDLESHLDLFKTAVQEIQLGGERELGILRLADEAISITV